MKLTSVCIIQIQQFDSEINWKLNEVIAQKILKNKYTLWSKFGITFLISSTVFFIVD